MNFKYKKHEKNYTKTYNNKITPMKKITPRHMIIKFLNKSDKEKILKAAGEKPHVTYRGTKLRKVAIPHLKLCKTLEQLL